MNTEVELDRPREFMRALRRLVHVGVADFMLHYFHALVARVVYAASRSRKPIDERLSKIIEDLKSNQFHIVTDPEIKRLAHEAFGPIMERLDKVSQESGPESRPIEYVTKAGYSGIQAFLGNQTHLGDFTTEEHGNIRDFCDNSGLSAVFRAFFRAHYGVCNVRSWRYLPISSSDHGNIRPHFDGLAPHTLKMMHFRGSIDEDSGCLMLLDKHDRVFAKTLGESPLIIFNANWIKHHATAPKTTRARDTVEITLMPQLKRTPAVVAGGFQAGNPVNPFRKWDRPIRSIVGI